jgi:hypothetical protein
MQHWLLQLSLLQAAKRQPQHTSRLLACSATSTLGSSAL